MVKTIVTCSLLFAANICGGFRAPTRVVASPSPLRAEATETDAPAEAEAAAPAPAAAAAFDPNNVFEMDESSLMAYIARSWNKLDGSDTVAVEDMLKDAATRATINKPDKIGASALTIAASLNVPKPELVKALLAAGANVNAKLGEAWSDKDTSALYRAVEGELLECVTLIVEAGADEDYLNDRKVFTGLAKVTALQRARDLGAKKIGAYLEAKGATAEMKEKPLVG